MSVAESAPVSREDFVARVGEANFAGMINEVLSAKGPVIVEGFAKSAEPRAQALNHEYQANLVEDEDALAKHVDHMRSISAKIVLLRDGYVPAIKINPDHAGMRMEACKIMAYIFTQFQAMEVFLL